MKDPFAAPQKSRLSDLVYKLRWAKSRESYRRIATESYRSDSNH